MATTEKNKETKCDHKFVLLSTKKTIDDSGYNSKYRRVDVFFCERCLEQKAIEKVEYLRQSPDWW